MDGLMLWWYQPLARGNVITPGDELVPNYFFTAFAKLIYFVKGISNL